MNTKGYSTEAVLSEEVRVVDKFDGFLKIESKESAEEIVARVASPEAARFYEKTGWLAIDPLHLQNDSVRKQLVSKAVKNINLVNEGLYSTLLTIQFCKPGDLVLVRIRDKFSLCSWLHKIICSDAGVRVQLLLPKAIKFESGLVANYIEVDRSYLAGKPIYGNFEPPVDNTGRIIEHEAFVEAETVDGHSITGRNVKYDQISDTCFIHVFPAMIGAKIDVLAAKRECVTLMEGEEVKQIEDEWLFMVTTKKEIEESSKELAEGDCTKEKFEINNPNSKDERMSSWWCGRVDKIMRALSCLKSRVGVAPTLVAKFEAQNLVENFAMSHLIKLEKEFELQEGTTVIQQIKLNYEELTLEQRGEQPVKKDSTSDELDGSATRAKKARLSELEFYKRKLDLDQTIRQLESLKHDFVRLEAAKRVNSVQSGDVVSVTEEQLIEMSTIHDENGTLVFGHKTDSAMLTAKTPMTVITTPQLMRRMAWEPEAPKYLLLDEPMRSFMYDLVAIMNNCGYEGDETKRQLFAHPRLEDPFPLPPSRFEPGETVCLKASDKHRWMVLALQADKYKNIFALLQHKMYDLNFICAASKLKPSQRITFDLRGLDRNGKPLRGRDRATYFCSKTHCSRDVFVLSADNDYCIVIDFWGEERATICTVRSSKLTWKNSLALRHKIFSFGKIPVDVNQDRRND